MTIARGRVLIALLAASLGMPSLHAQVTTGAVSGTVARPIALGTPSYVDVPGGSSITATLPDNQREIQVALKYIF